MKKLLFIFFWRLDIFFVLLSFILISSYFILGIYNLKNTPPIFRIYLGFVSLFISIFSALMVGEIFGIFYHKLLRRIYDSEFVLPFFVGKYVFIFPIEKLELIFKNAYSKEIITQFQYNDLLYRLYTVSNIVRRSRIYKTKVERFLYINKFQSAQIDINKILSILNEAYKDNLLSERQQKDFQNILLNRKMCPNCTTESQRDFDFCPVCGSELVEETKYNLDKLL